MIFLLHGSIIGAFLSLHPGHQHPRVFLLFEGKKVAKGKDKTKEEKLRPSDDELRDAICEILKEVDFNTVS